MSTNRISAATRALGASLSAAVERPTARRTPAVAGSSSSRSTRAAIGSVVSGFVDRIRQTRREYERGGGRATTRSDPRTGRVARGVRIEYTPEIDGDPDPGEVVWSWVPFEDDPSKGKDRPVVIIGRAGDDLVGVPLSSRNKGRHDNVPVGAGAWDRKRRPSWAKVDRLLRIDPEDVRREGSILPRDRFDLVVAATGRYHEFACV